MESKVVEYAPLANGRAGRLSLIEMAVLTVFGAALVLSLPFLRFRQTRTRVDAISGSMERQTTWPFGLTSEPVVIASPLELRLKKIGVQWSRDWQALSVTDYSILGNVLVRGCSQAPVIYGLRVVLPQFVATSNDDEIRNFVHVMQSGTEAERARQWMPPAKRRCVRIRQAPKANDGLRKRRILSFATTSSAQY